MKQLYAELDKEETTSKTPSAKTPAKYTASASSPSRPFRPSTAKSPSSYGRPSTAKKAAVVRPTTGKTPITAPKAGASPNKTPSKSTMAAPS